MAARNQRRAAIEPSQPSKASPAAGDVVIIGAGLAGLFTALKLAPLPVTVIAAAPLGEGASSMWAQGGIAAAVGEGDSTAKHAADTIEAGGGIVDAEVARLVADEGPDRIRDLLELRRAVRPRSRRPLRPVERSRAFRKARRARLGRQGGRRHHAGPHRRRTCDAVDPRARRLRSRRSHRRRTAASKACG